MYSVSKKKKKPAWLEVPACISHYADIFTHFKSIYKVQKVIDARSLEEEYAAENLVNEKVWYTSVTLPTWM